jgi:hypothetical protein
MFYRTDNREETEDVGSSDAVVLDMRINDKYLSYGSYTYNYFLVREDSINMDKSLFLVNNLDINEFRMKINNLGYKESRNLTLYSVLNKDDYSRGDTIKMKIMVDGKLYNIEDIVLNNSNERYIFKYVGNIFEENKKIYNGEIISLVSDPISPISNSTFVSGYDSLKRTQFKLNLNALDKKGNEVKLYIYKK